MELWTGTSGYSYKEWKGTFYPEDLPSGEMLRFYGERFRTVEINNTFYRMPKKEMLEKWALDVPAGFRFVLKAPQRITHAKRLKDAGGEVELLFENASALGEKLGPVFFQLPPFARKDVDRLRGFLEVVPKVRPIAFEFRHPTWFADDVYGVLREHGASLCLADVAEESEESEGEGEPAAPKLPTDIIPTADWGYLRLRRCDYGDADLAAWLERIRAQSWRVAYVFFKHEDEGTGPKLAARFQALHAASAG